MLCCIIGERLCATMTLGRNRGDGKSALSSASAGENAADDVGNLLHAERLGDEVHVRDVDIAPQLLLRIAGHEYNRHRWVKPADRARHRRPVHPRHYHVTEHEVESLAV